MNRKNLLINGVVEDNKLHVKMTGNPADMVTHLIGIINGTLESIADCLMYDAGNYPECKDEFFVCAANFLIGYYRAYKHEVVSQQECQPPIFEAFRYVCERFEAYIDPETVVDLKLELPSDELDVYMTYDELAEAIKRAKDLENCCEAQDVNCVKKELDSNEAGTRGDNNE